jgi:predicted metal-binding membrane protein
VCQNASSIYAHLWRQDTQVNTMNLVTSPEAIYKRDRAITILGIVSISILAWAYMAYISLSPNPIHTGAKMPLPQLHSWGPTDQLRFRTSADLLGGVDDDQSIGQPFKFFSF